MSGNMMSWVYSGRVDEDGCNVVMLNGEPFIFDEGVDYPFEWGIESEGSEWLAALLVQHVSGLTDGVEIPDFYSDVVEKVHEMIMQLPHGEKWKIQFHDLMVFCIKANEKFGPWALGQQLASIDVNHISLLRFWEKISKKILKDTDDPKTHQEMRRMFFTGAAAVLSLLKGTKGLETDKIVQILEKMDSECEGIMSMIGKGL